MSNFGANWERGMDYYDPQPIRVPKTANNWTQGQFSNVFSAIAKAAQESAKEQKQQQQTQQSSNNNQEQGVNRYWTPLRFVSTSPRANNPGNYWSPQGSLQALYFTNTPGHGLGQ